MTTPNALLSRILRARGIRRAELAAAAGVGTKTVSRICRGETDAMRVETLIRVAQALDLAPADLVPRLAARHPVEGKNRSTSRGKPGETVAFLMCPLRPPNPHSQSLLTSDFWRNAAQERV